MSNDFVKDISDMHEHYGVPEKLSKLTPEQLREFVKFRYNFLKEEMDELLNNTTNPEEIVDAMIDLCVVAIGSLHLFGVDVYKAWDEVHRANMSKQVGIKAERPNPLGLPDLIKPDGWKAPSHEGNHGWLGEVVTQ